MNDAGRRSTGIQPSRETIDELREKLEKMEGGQRRKRDVLPFGIPEIDQRLPGGGLSLNGIHEVAGGGQGTVDPAAATGFVAGIAARTKGSVIWCLMKPDVFAPALAQVGLTPDRVIYCESENQDELLSSTEECLRYGGLGAVIAEVPRLDMVASRRLQLAAEKSGTPGFMIRRWRRLENATDYGLPTASLTKWRVSSIPSAPLPVPGIGRSRWLIELIRARSSESADWEVEACDARGKMELVRKERYDHRGVDSSRRA